MTEQNFLFYSIPEISKSLEKKVSAFKNNPSLKPPFESFIQQILLNIKNTNPSIQAFTDITEQRALLKAKTLDQKIIHGKKLGKLAGVPFAVKNLFDIKNLVTLAGSKINAQYSPANKDAVLIQRLEEEDAILVGALNMGEYAYDFTGENAHYGNCKNPWNLSNMAGGSSSGSGASVAAGLVPFSLGSDTNGSIRVPSSFCGLYGLKPTYGRLPRTGSFPFVDSLDHVGPLAKNLDDLATVFEIIQGFDVSDHGCIDQPNVEVTEKINEGIADLRIKKAIGYFSCENFPQAKNAMDKISNALSINDSIELTGALEGRSAAYIITNIEGAAFHKPRLETKINDFDPDTRDRFIAGTTLPAHWYIRALQVRQWFHNQVKHCFNHTDVIIAPAVPCTAPKIGQKTLMINEEQVQLRPNLGYFTQPISAIGLPSLIVPTLDNESEMPIGIQIIAAPWREDICFRVAKYLEKQGFGELNLKK